jgi:hypothetical protein
VATSVRNLQRSREEIRVNRFTAPNASMLFVIRTIRRQSLPNQVAVGITVKQRVAGSSAAHCGDATVFAVIVVKQNRGRLWEKPLLERRRPAT